MELDGIEPVEDDGDGFIVQWGRWSWNENRPALAFTRQIAEPIETLPQVRAMWQATPVSSRLSLERAD